MDLVAQKKLLLIVNPKAGMQKAEKHLTELISIFYAHQFLPTVLITTKSGDAAFYAAKYAQDYDLLVCVGGDGTFNEVIDGIMHKQHSIPLGYIPAGSTNDFAASLGLSTQLPLAAEAIMHGSDHCYDIGKFNNRYFSYVASFGAFTKTSYSTPQSVKNALGHIAYLLEGIKDIPSIRKVHLRMETAECCLEGNYIFGAVSNSTSLGGILKLNPEYVDMNDGFFEIMLIKSPSNPIELQSILYALATQKYKECPFIDFIHTEAVTFFFDEAIPWSLDGEHNRGGTEVTIQNIHSAIHLIC